MAVAHVQSVVWACSHLHCKSDVVKCVSLDLEKWFEWLGHIVSSWLFTLDLMFSTCDLMSQAALSKACELQMKRTFMFYHLRLKI